jgi:hypothetical protein
MQLRYMGFDQVLNTRTYKFDAIERGLPTERHVVTADLGLFCKHHVGIQEGPTLCLQRLKEDLQTPAGDNCRLSEADLLEYLAVRAQAQERRNRNRGPKRPAARTSE